MARPRVRLRTRVLGGLLGSGTLLCLVCGGLTYRAVGPSPDYRELVSLEASTPLCFDDVSVFVGDADVLELHRRVLVEGDRIVEVDEARERCPDGYTVIDGDGRTLLPGYIDAHVHLFAPAGVPWAPHPPAPEHHLQALLASGVTTVYDLGGPASLLSDLRAEVESGAVVGPRVIHGDIPITVPDAHPIPAGTALARFPLTLAVPFGATVVADESEARGAVEARADLEYIKIIPRPTPRVGPGDERRSARSARRRGAPEAHARIRSHRD